MLTPHDSEIVSQVLAGDTDAFGILVDRYQDEFASYARHMTGSADDAADVIQESFVRAYRSLRKCQDPSNFKGWFFRIVSNQCKTHIARAGRRRTDSLDAVNAAAAPDDPERDAITGELRQRVHAALRGLPPDQREVLILKYVEDRGVADVAKMLDLSVSAVKMRLLRGRKALVDQLLGVGE